MVAVANPVKAEMSVPLLDLRAQYQPLKAEIMQAIGEVCDNQSFILGPNVKRLESDVAAYTQSHHGIGVSSGTDALLVALMALDIGPGDEIITSPYTFFATGGVIARLRARPIYCDIDPATYNLSAAAVQRFIDDQCDHAGGTLRNRVTGGRIRALMPVHLYGQCADMDALMSIANRYGLAVVEDAAQAIGSEAGGGRRAGSIGAIGCFSFFPSKNLGAFGDGGMCTANDDALAEKLRVLRVHGGKPKYYHQVVGGNFRLDEIQAAVLNVKLKHLDAWTAARQRNADHYDRLFKEAGLTAAVGLPFRTPGYRHIFNQYVVRVAERDRLREHLSAHHIGTEIYYPVPLHLQKCFTDLGGKAGDCPESERAARETVALPVYPELVSEQLEYVVETIGRFYG
jgi:dTDP-4-amino-4,6-dideoxygalactose transaminase